MKIINNYCFVTTIMHTSINNYTYMYQQLYILVCINNYTYMYQKLYILTDCLCKETNKNINNYICYSILYKKHDINVVLYMIGIILTVNNGNIQFHNLDIFFLHMTMKLFTIYDIIVYLYQC